MSTGAPLKGRSGAAALSAHARRAARSRALGRRPWPHPSESLDWALFAAAREAAHVWHNASYAELAAALPDACPGPKCDTATAALLWWPVPSNTRATPSNPRI